MEPFRRQVRALTGRTALGGALLFAMAGVAAALGGPAMPAAPAAQHALRTAAAMEQPAALVYARNPRLQMDHAGRLRLTCMLDNRGGSSATAVQMQVLAFNAKRQLVAGSSFSVYGLNIAPGGRQVTSVLLPRLLTLTGRGNLRYVVSITGGTGARIWWRETALLQQFLHAARFAHPLFADGVTTGPAGERHPRWQALPAK